MADSEDPMSTVPEYASQPKTAPDRRGLPCPRLTRAQGPKLRASNVNFFYGVVSGAVRYLPRHAGPQDHGADRPFGVRQVDLPAQPEPHQRHHPQLAHGRADPAGQRGRPRGGRHQPAAACGHGVPTAESLSQIDLRQYRLRTAHQRHGQPQRDARQGRAQPAARGALGRR